METAVIYARYSCSNQTEQSIEGQLRVCEDFAQRKNIVIVDSYIDRATTGTNDKRPEFQQKILECPFDINGITKKLLFSSKYFA